MSERSGRRARRVVVTGLGAVSGLGLGAREFTAAIREGRSGIGPARQFDTTGFDHQLAGEVADFDPAALLERLDHREWGRSGQFAAAAARMAAEDAGFAPGALAAARTASCFGTTNGESQVLERLATQRVERGAEHLDAALAGRADAGRIATAVNHELGLTGEALTLGTACAAGNYALGYGFDLVSTGEADVVLCGGADASNRATHAGFHRLGALAADVPRPFDEHRDGIVTAEGGAALLLEPLEAALARGARVYAEVLGYGMTCDARHMTNPHGPSIAECVRRAHRMAGVKPEEVDYICAHGTGTPANEAAEIAAVREAFGDTAPLPPVSSVKSMLGHTMGAAAAFGALVCCAALHEGFLPPSATVRTVDPALGPDLDCVPGRAREARPAIAQNHGFAFGGNNAVAIFGRFDA
ncbi:3-oxoacyl-ACP synthase [Streptomyces eurocidicus]|uniref:3-oxoacyl-[acyl-carrier-protein] synthase 1 n=1 Tax=Streptomyces eurocidicus TaxID=66423 RepID=A0A2N8NXZ4_STREU|nr:beta-ketoacyl-[acyl-carrier-protein] synthase family protein [Streptomyces eurocidicus]MBB5119737.1 3-oxoacyl-[acyl-carrier-protein] synthase II [Streptomyces eurocidicus]MBF6050760.1 beta-ketoacyl-[acyl-carrier-protein] synthase family protein [Streptomyces eurocidicus]PNE33635.1 3-oxoacyl-ACP synthase [Streptomyces eurocidicus]